MIVVDTSAWIDYVNGIDGFHTQLIDYGLEHSRIITGGIIITEFLQGLNRRRILIEQKDDGTIGIS